MTLTDEQIEKAALRVFTECYGFPETDFTETWVHPRSKVGKAQAEARAHARAALEAVMPGEPVDCPECQGTGLRDTGGVHPWGEYILVPCDHCAAHPAPEPGEVERLREALRAMVQAHETGKFEPMQAAYEAARAALAEGGGDE